MKKYLISILLLIIFPLGANAANVLFKFNTNEIIAGQQYQLDVVFDRQTDQINAIEARIILPISLFSDITIKDGNSTVSLWVQKPKIEITNGVGLIDFSAVSPSGINGLLFSILFTGQEASTGLFSFEGNILLSDGKGTRIGLPPQEIPLTIHKPTTQATTTSDTSQNFNSDKESPEDFEIFVARDAKLFNNQWFAVFNTQDKDSGIGFHEALETDDESPPESQTGWMKTESPYLFKNQSLKKLLYIKAVDRNGNSRISVWKNPNLKTSPLEQKVKIYVIIILIFLVLLAVIFELYLRRHKK